MSFSTFLNFLLAVSNIYVCVCACVHMLSPLVMSDSLLPHYPWKFSGKNTGVGCHFLLWGIFLTQGSNPRLLHLLHHWVPCKKISPVFSELIFIYTFILNSNSEFNSDNISKFFFYSLNFYKTLQIIFSFGEGVGIKIKNMKFAFWTALFLF